MKAEIDSGLNHYTEFKQLYLKAQSLLDNDWKKNRKELSDILHAFDSNHDATAWIEAEFGNEFKTLHEKLMPIANEEKSRKQCKRSWDIIDDIEKCFRRDDGLYRPCFKENNKGGLEEIHTDVHASMAILYSILGNSKEAKNILSRFEEKIQNRASLYRWSDRGEAILTYDNAMIAVAYASIGNRQRADEIFDAIESNCRKLPDSLYDEVICDLSERLEPHELCAKPNAAMGIAHRVIGNDSRANAIIPALNEMFRVRDSMLSHNSMKYPLKRPFEVERRFICTSTNASIVFANLISGGYEAAQIILEEIERKKDAQAPFYTVNLRGDVCFGTGKPDMRANDSALMAIAYAMQDGAKLCGLPNRERRAA